MSLKSFIYNNPLILYTLFHLHNPLISIINDNERIIIKPYEFHHLIKNLPLLKDFFSNLLHNNDIIFHIHESFDTTNNSFTYTTSIQENPIFNDFTSIYDIKYNIHLSQDKSNKNNINCYTSISKNLSTTNDNPLYHSIILIIINYLETEHTNYVKNQILLKEVKPLFESSNHPSFVLNII